MNFWLINAQRTTKICMPVWTKSKFKYHETDDGICLVPLSRISDWATASVLSVYCSQQNYLCSSKMSTPIMFRSTTVRNLVVSVLRLLWQKSKVHITKNWERDEKMINKANFWNESVECWNNFKGKRVNYATSERFCVSAALNY